METLYFHIFFIHIVLLCLFYYFQLYCIYLFLGFTFSILLSFIFVHAALQFNKIYFIQKLNAHLFNPPNKLPVNQLFCLSHLVINLEEMIYCIIFFPPTHRRHFMLRHFFFVYAVFQWSHLGRR